MHQRMIEIERKKRGDKYSYERDKYASSKDIYTSENDPYMQKFDAFETLPPPKSAKSLRREFDFEDIDDTPRSNASSSNKFNFEEHGFESDFNSPPPSTTTAPTTSGSVATKSSFRFSNDFSDNKEKIHTSFGNGSDQQQQEFILNNQTPTQKLRFDDKVTISKFENEQPTATTVTTAITSTTGAFEDDFSQAQFVFDDNQWNSSTVVTSATVTTATTEPLITKSTMKNHLRLSKRQENIKKSESVNIFARKTEDPFEDDDFFKTTTTITTISSTTSPIQQQQQKLDNLKGMTNKRNNGNNGSSTTQQFQWDSNFAKFDENM